MSGKPIKMLMTLSIQLSLAEGVRGEAERGLGGAAAAAGDNLTEPFNISDFAVDVVVAVCLLAVVAIVADDVAVVVVVIVVVVRLPVVVAVKLSFPSDHVALAFNK